MADLKSYHGIAARIDRMPISNFHRKILWLLGGVTFCDSVDMAVGGPIGMVLQSNGFDVQLSTLMTVVMQCGIPVGVGLLTFYVEKVNRKTILIVTYVLIAILGPIWSMLPTDQPYLVMGFGFLVCVFTFTNSVTTAAIYLSEPFPTACRIRGAGVANAFGRLGGIFSPMWIAFFVASPIGTTGAYLVNSCLAIFMAIWLAIFGVETRGKTLEEITEGLLDK